MNKSISYLRINRPFLLCTFYCAGHLIWNLPLLSYKVVWIMKQNKLHLNVLVWLKRETWWLMSEARKINPGRGRKCWNQRIGIRQIFKEEKIATLYSDVTIWSKNYPMIPHLPKSRVSDLHSLWGTEWTENAWLVKMMIP